MTRRKILKKCGYSYTSGADLNEKISEPEAEGYEKK